MKKRVILSYPNLRWIKTDNITTWNLNPSTLCLLGAMVQDYAEVKVVDGQFYDLDMADYIQEIKRYNPDFIGLSLLSSEYAPVLHVAAKEIKKHLPQVTIIVGGIHATKEYAQVILDENIDYVVRGEGEYVLLDLIKYLSGLSDLPTMGLVYRKDGIVVVQEKSYIEDLTKLPPPNYDLVDMEVYARKAYIYRPSFSNPPKMPGVRISVTRGCPLQCSFCQVSDISGLKTRVRDPEQVVQELQLLKSKYGVQSVIFDDDNISGNKRFFKNLLRCMINTQLNMEFVIGAFAVFTLDEEMLDLMKQAGCVAVNIALETGNQRVMDEIVHKPVKLSKALQWIQKIKAKGIAVACNFMIGFPGESWSEIRQTIKFAESCAADYVKFFIAVPLKGTKLWDMAQSNDLLVTNNSQFSMADKWGQVSGHGVATIKSDEWTGHDLQILRAYEWDRINFANSEKEQKIAQMWNISLTELNDIRKKTRSAIA